MFIEKVILYTLEQVFLIFDTDELAFESRAGDLPAGKEHVLYDYIYGEQSALPSDLSFTGNSLISTTDFSV